MDRHDNLLLGLMILYQLQSSFARPKHALHAPSYYYNKIWVGVAWLNWLILHGSNEVQNLVVRTYSTVYLPIKTLIIYGSTIHK